MVAWDSGSQTVHPAGRPGLRTPSAVQGSRGVRPVQAERGASARPCSLPLPCDRMQSCLGGSGWLRRLAQTGGYGAHWDWVGVVHGAGTEMLVRGCQRGCHVAPARNEGVSLFPPWGLCRIREGIRVLEGTRVSAPELLSCGAVDVQGG